MIRNTVLYRRFWYMKRQNARKISIIIKLAAIIIIFAALVSYARKMIYPYIMEYTLNSLNELAVSAVNDAVDDLFGGDIEYSRLVSMEQNGENVVSLRMDMVEAGRLSRYISRNIEERLKVLEDGYITVPLGTLLGSQAFSQTGPHLQINIKASSKVETRLKSEFSAIDHNRTMHKIILEVRTVIKTGMPFITDSFYLSATVPVTERVIIGVVS